MFGWLGNYFKGQSYINYFGLTGNSPPGEEGEQPLISEDNEQEPNEETNISAFLSNAWSKVGVGFKANKDESSVQQENIPDEPIESAPEAPEAANNAEEQEASRVNFFTNFSSMVGKVANNATTVIKDKVSTSIIGEFNKQQDDFIKNKGKQSLYPKERAVSSSLALLLLHSGLFSKYLFHPETLELNASLEKLTKLWHF